MSTDDIIKLVASISSGILGGLAVAIINHFFVRRKTNAETLKIQAETEKIRVETQKISVEMMKITSTVDEMNSKLGDTKERQAFVMTLDEKCEFVGGRDAVIAAVLQIERKIKAGINPPHRLVLREIQYTGEKIKKILDLSSRTEQQEKEHVDLLRRLRYLEEDVEPLFNRCTQLIMTNQRFKETVVILGSFEMCIADCILGIRDLLFSRNLNHDETWELVRPPDNNRLTGFPVTKEQSSYMKENRYKAEDTPGLDPYTLYDLKLLHFEKLYWPRALPAIVLYVASQSNQTMHQVDIDELLNLESWKFRIDSKKYRLTSV